MEIKQFKTTVKEVTEGFVDHDEEGVFAFSGKLNIRPKYQRNFVYNDKQQKAVIDTIFKGFPLNVMYWVDQGDDQYGILDGQQRTMSFCKFRQGLFSVEIGGYTKTFANLTPDEKEKFLDYELMVYICKGTESEKLAWFRVINIAGEELTPQELLNAAYVGAWLDSAKTYFSKTNCVASLLAKDYVSVRVNRQELLELALNWISNGNAEGYMSAHQNDSDAAPLWEYFQKVIEWVKSTFTDVEPSMKGVNWGLLYEKYHGNTYDPSLISSQVQKLIGDVCVENKKGIYEYILGGSLDTKLLEVRVFNKPIILAAYKKQTAEANAKHKSNCPLCAIGHDSNRERIYTLEEMDADHVTAWSRGGATRLSNCQMLCKTHNRAKGNK